MSKRKEEREIFSMRGIKVPTVVSRRMMIRVTGYVTGKEKEIHTHAHKCNKDLYTAKETGREVEGKREREKERRGRGNNQEIGGRTSEEEQEWEKKGKKERKEGRAKETRAHSIFIPGGKGGKSGRFIPTRIHR